MSALKLKGSQGLIRIMFPLVNRCVNLSFSVFGFSCSEDWAASEKALLTGHFLPEHFKLYIYLQ